VSPEAPDALRWEDESAAPPWADESVKVLAAEELPVSQRRSHCPAEV
jgi:hypothetical protein